MESWLLQLQSLQGVPAYGLTFALLFSCGIGAPMNEDIVLLVAAALTLGGVMDPGALIVVSWFGLLAGDGLIFHFGHRLGPRIVATQWVARYLPAARYLELQQRIRHRGPAYLFVVRFLPGIRTALFFVAGTMKLPYRALFLYDGLAAAIELPLLVYGVRYIGGNWHQLLGWVQQFQYSLLLALTALGSAWLLRRQFGRGD